MTNIPMWPAKLTREQRRAAKQRKKDFYAALKDGTAAAGWRFAYDEIFRQTGDWFACISPWLLWERGVWVQITVKPMALDPLFWDIAGMSENEALPLSFRANGAWVLRPSPMEDHIGLDTMDVTSLAAKVLSWSNRQAEEILENISLQSMLAALPHGERLRGQRRTLAICLHILAGNLDAAMRLCRIDDPDISPSMRESGGFETYGHDGSASTFLDQARVWIARKRRGELNIADVD